jgi:hypothetical protein
MKENIATFMDAEDTLTGMWRETNEQTRPLCMKLYVI